MLLFFFQKESDSKIQLTCQIQLARQMSNCSYMFYNRQTTQIYVQMMGLPYTSVPTQFFLTRGRNSFVGIPVVTR